ncbi:protein SSUH2 homolog isoform X1 [Myxocyprinus asiaticus]|uniref:protein SSUH2 homolog isoform X1 n=2 Tax=Myxocyprinus asiaticus TaxID=70543 RepID=UPI0022235522|nr:protein SSUH2 homolog isoform X1 [Myxocyprinus asiaticus]
MDRPIASDCGPSYGSINPVFATSAMSAPPAAGTFGPSAPPASMFDTVPGYEGTMAGGGGGYLPPPMPSVPTPAPEPSPNQPEWLIPSISEERAREALATYVASKCCYSSAPVKEGVITNMESFNTYRYRLETFTESRSSEWSQEPYSGQPVDAGAQPAPGPWQIAVQAPAFFQEHKQTIKVPYTSSVKNCHSCLGMGRSLCSTCAGAGNKVCWVCNGSGLRVGDDRCTHCNGRGCENCSFCSGNGSLQCDTCHGKGQLLVFINLNVKWSTEKDDFVAQQLSGLKEHNLERVSGKELFRDTQYMLYPVMGFPDASLVQASERLVRDHQVKFAQTSRILQQRQTIELIPITKVNYMWKGKPHVYFVYGNEFEVNADDYPATCCCSVM